ncbi:hypothetical protein B0O80DRAFT_164539 [Mortierella sp. GBAus27b]|nr:hypothetical protein B0O80DRAFT_164539 [Mortierella sp. GBAus27b]
MIDNLPSGNQIRKSMETNASRRSTTTTTNTTSLLPSPPTHTLSLLRFRIAPRHKEPPTRSGRRIRNEKKRLEQSNDKGQNWSLCSVVHEFPPWRIGLLFQPTDALSYCVRVPNATLSKDPGTTIGRMWKTRFVELQKEGRRRRGLNRSCSTFFPSFPSRLPGLLPFIHPLPHLQARIRAVMPQAWISYPNAFECPGARLSFKTALRLY